MRCTTWLARVRFQGSSVCLSMIIAFSESSPLVSTICSWFARMFVDSFGRDHRTSGREISLFHTLSHALAIWQCIFLFSSQYRRRLVRSVRSDRKKKRKSTDKEMRHKKYGSHYIFPWRFCDAFHSFKSPLGSPVCFVFFCSALDVYREDFFFLLVFKKSLWQTRREQPWRCRRTSRNEWPRDFVSFGLLIKRRRWVPKGVTTVRKLLPHLRAC